MILTLSHASCITCSFFVDKLISRQVAATLSEAVGILRQGSFFASHACAAPSDRLVIVHPGVHAGAVFTTPATVVGAGK